MDFLTDVPLAPYTTFRIGGPARWYAEAEREEDVAEAVDFARERSVPLFVLGGGSNVLVADAGFPGLALRICIRGVNRQAGAGCVAFEVGAGEDWDPFVARTVEENCAGVECLSGIPGSAGGVPVQNVGAYGQEVAETIARVRVFDRSALQFVSMTGPECKFGYRRSLFNSTHRDRYIVCRVDFHLREDGPPAIVYQDLRRFFEGRSPTLEQTRSAVRSIRARKGMLIAAGDPDSKSAGSFFRNPIASEGKVEELARALGLERGGVPGYSLEGGEVKLPAAWLLEQAGFRKGYRMGRAGISSRHTLALINCGGATAAEIAALRDKIVETVRARFGILLEPEPIWVG